MTSAYDPQKAREYVSSGAPRRGTKGPFGITLINGVNAGNGGCR